MKISNWTKAIIGTFVVFSMSCTNLDEELFSEVTIDEFGETEEEISAAVAAAYTGWTGGFVGEPWSLAEVASDEMVVPTRAQDWFDNGNWQRLHMHTHLPQDDRVSFSWTTLFGGINTANRLIKQFQEAGQPDDGPAIGELRALRGLLYYFLMDLYGNVPLQKSFDETEISNGSGSDYSQRTEVYNFIVSELEAVKDIEGIPENDNSRMNKWAIYMTLAKLYLNEAVYTSAPVNGSYRKASDASLQKVIDYTTKVINEGGFQLNSDYFGNFNADNLGSSENIMVVVYDEVFAGGMNINMRTLHYGSQDTYNFTAQPWNGYCTLQEFYESFDESDRRLGDMEFDVEWPDHTDPLATVDRNTSNRAMFVVGPQFKADGSPVTDDSQYDEPDGETLVFSPSINEIGPRTLRQAGARIGKYVFEQGATENMNNDYPVYRLADAYFMRAEAKWKRNGDEAGALDDISEVSTLRYESGDLPLDFSVDNAGSRLGNHLLGERAREFAFEYWRRNDLIRFGLYNNPWWGKGEGSNDPQTGDPAFGDGAVHTQIFPIPRAQLEANAGLSQNPGY